MEELSSLVDVFPMHIIQNIVKFIPNHRSNEVKLSCKDLYEAFWKNEKDAYKIMITEDIVSKK